MLQLSGRILRHRGLLATLVARELKARYRGSVLGFLWSLVNPLLLFLVYTFVFTRILPGGRAPGAQPYALFLMIGLFPWIWASTSVLEGTVSLTTNASLIRKAVFPVELLPIVPVLANLTHFVFAVPVIAAALLVGRGLGHEVGGWPAILLPLVVLIQLPLISGFVLALAALNVHFKDVRDIVINLTQLLFFMTPILYPIEWVSFPVLSVVIRWLNPFTPFTLAYQEVLFRGGVPEATIWLHMLAWTAIVWLLGAGLFSRLRASLVEAA